jgi:hypothetical protein
MGASQCEQHQTTVTGALHGTLPRQPYDETALQGQLCNTTSIQITSYKFYASEPFLSVRKLEKDEDRSERA